MAKHGKNQYTNADQAERDARIIELARDPQNLSAGQIAAIVSRQFGHVSRNVVIGVCRRAGIATRGVRPSNPANAERNARARELRAARLGRATVEKRPPGPAKGTPHVKTARPITEPQIIEASQYRGPRPFIELTACMCPKPSGKPGLFCARPKKPHAATCEVHKGAPPNMGGH